MEKVATDKKYCLFWLLAKAKAYKEIGRICEVSGEKVRQVFDKLLSKSERHLNHWWLGKQLCTIFLSVYRIISVWFVEPNYFKSIHLCYIANREMEYSMTLLVFFYSYYRHLLWVFYAIIKSRHILQSRYFGIFP